MTNQYYAQKFLLPSLPPKWHCALISGIHYSQAGKTSLNQTATPRWQSMTTSRHETLAFSSGGGWSIPTTSAAVTVSSAMVAGDSTKPHRVESSELLGLFSVEGTFWWRDLVSGTIIAIRVLHVLPPEVHHFSPLLGCDAGGDGGSFWGGFTLGWRQLNRIDCTAMEDKVGELCDKGSIFVIHFIFSPSCSPARSIPYCGIQRHWLWREVSTHWFCSLDFSNGDIIYIKAARTT